MLSKCFLVVCFLSVSFSCYYIVLYFREVSKPMLFLLSSKLVSVIFLAEIAGSLMINLSLN